MRTQEEIITQKIEARAKDGSNSVLECLPHICEALGSIPHLSKQNKKKKVEEEKKRERN
jgi:hypothetical protein